MDVTGGSCQFNYFDFPSSFQFSTVRRIQLLLSPIIFYRVVLAAPFWAISSNIHRLFIS
jgi:hypothetical protein